MSFRCSPYRALISLSAVMTPFGSRPGTRIIQYSLVFRSIRLFLRTRVFLRRAPQLFRKIDVFDPQESEVRIIVKFFRADDLFPDKGSILQGTVDTDIQRPFVLKKVFFYIGDKGTFFKEIIMATTGCTIPFCRWPARRLPYNGIHCLDIERLYPA